MTWFWFFAFCGALVFITFLMRCNHEQAFIIRRLKRRLDAAEGRRPYGVSNLLGGGR